MYRYNLVEHQSNCDAWGRTKVCFGIRTKILKEDRTKKGHQTLMKTRDSFIKCKAYFGILNIVHFFLTYIPYIDIHRESV